MRMMPRRAIVFANLKPLVASWRNELTRRREIPLHFEKARANMWDVKIVYFASVVDFRGSPLDGGVALGGCT
jgi:hypothetical protein